MPQVSTYNYVLITVTETRRVHHVGIRCARAQKARIIASLSRLHGLARDACVTVAAKLFFGASILLRLVRIAE